MRTGRPRPTAPDSASSASVFARGGLGQPPGGGELRAGVEDARSNHRQHALALRGMRGVDEPVQAQCAQRPQHRRDIAMPWGRERTMSKASSRPTSGSSLSSRRRVSIFPLGHLERLARVRFLTLPFSRQPSRRRMAGGEFRMGTVSMYMATMCSRFIHANSDEQSLLHGNILLSPKRHLTLRINPLDCTEREKPGGTSG